MTALPRCPCGGMTTRSDILAILGTTPLHPDKFEALVAYVEGVRPPKLQCRQCGHPQSKAEGGTVFTLCDECWPMSATMHAKRADLPPLDWEY